MDDFTTVFLFTTSTASPLVIIWGVSAIAIGIAVFAWQLFTKIEMSLRTRMVKAFSLLLCIYVCMFLIASNIENKTIVERRTVCGQLCASKERCQRLIDIYNNHEYKIAEGTVHVLYQSLGSRDGGDIIEVDGKRLNINNAVATCGYTDVIVHNGVLQEGVYAKIYYIEDKMFDTYDETYYVILRIDLKDQNKDSYSPN